MNKPHALPAVLLTIISLPGMALADGLFDAPGPGYRRQAERVFPAGERTPQIRVDSASLYSPRIRVEPASAFSSSLPGPLADFSQPIRLSLSVVPPRDVHFRDAPEQPTPKKAQ